MIIRFCILLCLAQSLSAESITILVNPGPFNNVQDAAYAEERVDWWDANLADDRACTESFAAMELASFLKTLLAVSDDDICFSRPGNVPSEGHVIVLGSRKSNSSIEPLGFSSAAMNGDESFRLHSKKEKNRCITLIEGRERVGTLYGVYAYLEKLGMRFYGLGEKGTVYPKIPVSLPAKLDIVENPDFRTRGFWAWEDRGNDEFFLWMARNRMNYWTSDEKEIPFLKKLGLKLTQGGHVIQKYYLGFESEYPYNHPKFDKDNNKPDDPYPVGDEYAGDTDGDGKLTYFEAHPEWFGLRDGKRSNRMIAESGDNYCTSNNDATRELAKNLIQSLIDGRWKYADIVNFWMLDGGKWCECDSCRELGSFTDRLLAVLHTVMTEIHKAQKEGRLQRRIEIAAPVYVETIPPPTKELPENFDYKNCYMTYFPIQRCYAHSLADPDCTEINQSLKEAYLGWTGGEDRFYKGDICIGEYYNVSSLKSMPVLFPTVMAKDIPWYYETGSRHFHYMHSPTRRWGTWRLNQYLLGRLLWDTKADAESILNEYFQRFYPTTTEITRSFYNRLEDASKNIKAYKHAIVINGSRHRMRDALADDQCDLFPSNHLKYERYTPEKNDGPDVVEIIESVQAARRAIDDALIDCSDDTERERLLMDECRFAYGESMYFFYYYMIRTTLFHRQGLEEMARFEFMKVERYAERLREVTDLVQVASSHANSKNGLEASQINKVYEKFKEKYGQADK